MQLQPQEIEVWYVIPAIRRELCKSLVDEGLNQKQAAQFLGLTEAAVSHYINSKRAAKFEFTKDFKKYVEKISGKVKKGELNGYQAVQMLLMLSRMNGELCSVHKKFDKNVPHGCESALGHICGVKANAK